MRISIFILATLLMISLAGCAKQEMYPALPADAPEVQSPAVNERPVEPAPQEPAKEATIEGQKQLSLGATSIKNETQTVISGIECRFTDGKPSKFSFNLTNMEEKKWVFEYVPANERNEKDNPVLIINARQLVNSNMAKACARRTIDVNESVMCNFDVYSNPIISTALASGTTGFGHEKKNKLVVKTVGHVSEVTFFCE